MSRLEEVEALSNMFHTAADWNKILHDKCRTLAAEVDEWKEKERITSELFEAACNDLGDAQEELAAAIEYANSRDAEVDELQRRLDAVVAALKPAQIKWSKASMDSPEYHAWCLVVPLYAQAVAIAEGREG